MQYVPAKQNNANDIKAYKPINWNAIFPCPNLLQISI